jgi:hypothetical protein
MIFFSNFILVKNERPGVDIRNRPRIPIPDEDPYSVAGIYSVRATRNMFYNRMLCH